MIRHLLRSIALPAVALVAGCVAPAEELPLPPDAGGPVGQMDPADITAQVLSAARERFGTDLVDQALDAPSYLVAYQTYGGLPVPPPPGEPFPPPPPPAMALMARRDGTWLFAEKGIWRQARPEQVAEIEAIAASAAFRQEPVHVPPCPDYGSTRLLLKMPGLARIARDHACPSQTGNLILAAMRA